MKLPRLLPVFAAVAAAALAGAIVGVTQDPDSEVQQDAVPSDAFVDLFDGESLTGWDGDPALWRVEDGAITGERTAEMELEHNSFLTWADGELDDFELVLEYRIFSGNSGVQIRSAPIEGRPWGVGGYQADLDAANQWTGALYEEAGRGMLAPRGETATVAPGGAPETTGATGDPDALAAGLKDGDWNTYRIVAQGHRILTEINGERFAEIVDEDPDGRRRAGLLALQLHRGEPMKVQFRNLRLRRLPLQDLKKVVYVAGPPSHRPREHEHNAGALFATRLLNEYHGDKVLAVAYLNGWPADRSAFQNADAVVVQSDGGPRHPAYWHLRQIDYLRGRGVGVGMIHYAVEMTPDESNDTLIRATGGAFEVHWSVNPHWDAEFAALPDHPVARGVEPFEIRDEWYFNMRFLPEMEGVTPILSAVPPAETMSRQDGRHSGNPAVREMVAAGQPQHVCWVVERPEGGRGFGFTGLHFHDNWAHDGFRTTVLNAICWIAGVEIPAEGIATPTPTQAELDANLDPKEPR